MLPKNYQFVIEGLKDYIFKARLNAAASLNKQMLWMYWHIGDQIRIQQQEHQWGGKIIDALSQDLRRAFPDMKGLGSTNLHNMRRFAAAYRETEIVQQAAGQIPWYHHVLLMEKVKSTHERLWYIHKTIENGWSRNVLALQIASKLYSREGKALTNFKTTLPPAQSQLVQQIFKNPYNLEFIGATEELHEREIESALVQKIKAFLLELGSGFAFVGSQYNLRLDGEDYFLDLLFYHIKLKRYVVIELKTDKFKPEFAGKLNFYLTLVDKTLKDESDHRSIGIILCRDNKKLTVEYSLENMQSPVGVSTYTLTRHLPKTFKKSLPSPEEWAQRINLMVDEREQLIPIPKPV